MPDVGTNVQTTTGFVNAYTGVATTTDDLSVGMKTYWDTEMLENMRPKMVYVQFGRKHPLPRNRGKVIEWRKWGKLANITRLVEGVIKTGLKMTETAVYAYVAQYGDYITISEQLDLKHVDPVILGAEEELSAAAANTMDILTRDGVMAEATNVLFAETLTKASTSNEFIATGDTPTVPYGLRNDGTNPLYQNPLTPDTVAQAVTQLKALDVPQMNDRYYVAVVHPFAAYDLRKSEEWHDFHQYAATEEIFNGEIGELHGCRFVETTNAPVMVGDTLYSAAQRYLTLASTNPYQTLTTAGTISSGNGYGEGTLYVFNVKEDLNGAAATADYEKQIGQYILFSDNGTIDDRLTIVGIDVANDKVYVDKAPTDGAAAENDTLHPGNGGAESKTSGQVAVFATMFLGKEPYGVIDPAEGNVHMIIKPKQQIGGPLEQFSTVGVKFETGTKILYQDRVLVCYHTGRYSKTAKANWSLTA